MTHAGDLHCRELVERLTEYLEGQMPDRDRARLEAHLELCEACRAYVDQLRETLRLAGRIAPEHLTGAMREDLLRAFAAWSHERP